MVNIISQRNVINLNFPTFEFNYAYIDHLTAADSMLSPSGSAFNATPHTYQQLIDQNGWPNATEASGQAFGGGARFPASGNFSGPYVITWDGDGQFNINAPTWTEASTTSVAVGNANGTTTLSGFSSVVGIAPSFGITGTGVPGGTTVVSVNYSTKTVVVSAAVTAGSGITFTFTNGTYTKNANGRWTNTPGIKPYIVASITGGATTNILTPFTWLTTGTVTTSVSSMAWASGTVTVTTAAPHGRPVGSALYLTFFGATPATLNATFLCTVTGASTLTFALVSNPGTITGTLTFIAFVTNGAIYRQSEEVDFMPTSLGGNGLLFRAPFKRLFVNASPSVIRFLNWINGNSSKQCRWENRSVPSKAGLSLNATAGPAYGVTTGANNQYVLAAVSTGTAGNPNLTPASMVHGELACCRIGNSAIRAQCAPTAITKGSPAQVTAAGHGYSNGDIVIFTTANQDNVFIGMVELNYVPCIVTVIDVNTFSLADLSSVAINSTTFSTFVANGNKSNSAFSPYVSLQVGSGSDRTAYPVVDGLAVSSPYLRVAGNAGTLTTGSYFTFYFDKNIAGRRTAGAGNPFLSGVWIAQPGFPQGEVPVEYCARLVSEVNQMSPPPRGPIHAWFTAPPRSLQPVDPNYSSGSDWVLNCISTVFTTGLGNAHSRLIIEWSNEVWNFSAGGCAYACWLNYLRDPVGLGANTANFPPMQGLRSAIMSRNINTNSPYWARVCQTIGMQGTFGWTGANQQAALGNGLYFTDAWNTWGAAAPLSFADCVNWASYFDTSGLTTYTNTVTGTGTFTDDSAMFNGTNNSGNGGVDYSGAANPTQACQNFVNQITSPSAPSQGTVFYQTQAASFDSGMAAQGRRHIQYEGGANWSTTTGQSMGTHVITAGDSAFLLAVYESAAWATAQKNFFNSVAVASSVAGPMSIFTFLSSTNGSGFRWAYAAPDTYPNPVGSGVEGDALNLGPMWTTMQQRNQALVDKRQLIIKVS